MNSPATIKLILPSELIPIIKGDFRLMRITSLLLFLKALYPEGRFTRDKENIERASLACGFRSVKGFDNNIIDLVKEGLIKYTCHNGGKLRYAEFATWPEIKKKFGYESNGRAVYHVSPACQYKGVMDIVRETRWKKVREKFGISIDKRVSGNQELQDMIENVCGTLSRRELHQCQLNLFCNGKYKDLVYDSNGQHLSDIGYAIQLFLYGFVKPNSSTEDKAERFFLKGDYEVSTGYMSKDLGYKNRNGICYHKKRWKERGDINVLERVYEVTRPELRTTTKLRKTGLGNTFFDRKGNRLLLKMNDAITFNNPETVNWEKQTLKTGELPMEK